MPRAFAHDPLRHVDARARRGGTLRNWLHAESIVFLSKDVDVAQVKKAEVRAAVLNSARRMFIEKGYANTQLSAIAAAAKTSKSNIYKYYGSKFELLMALYDPWLRERVAQLEAETLAAPRAQRLRTFLRILLVDIPQEDSCFANLLMQALGTDPQEYSPDLLRWFEGKIAEILSACIDEDLSPAEFRMLAELIVLVHDGFLIASRVKRVQHFSGDLVDQLARRLFDQKQATASDPH